jgi:hypothetical protein
MHAIQRAELRCSRVRSKRPLPYIPFPFKYRTILLNFTRFSKCFYTGRCWWLVGCDQCRWRQHRALSHLLRRYIHLYIYFYTPFQLLSWLGMDHVAFLGPTIEDIARNKAGICRKGRVCLFGPEGPVHVIQVSGIRGDVTKVIVFISLCSERVYF